MAAPDLAEILRSWPYDPDDNVRLVECADGRQVMQVRQPMGVEQYEIDGRPDGQRPHGMESALDYHLTRRSDAKRRTPNAKFALSHDACVELINEGTLYYYRYVHFFQIHDWQRTARDTARNMRMFDLVAQCAQDPDDAQVLEQWRPYLIRMNAVARSMIHVEKHEHHKALQTLRTAIQAVESAPQRGDEETFRVERERSLDVMRALAKDIEAARPRTELERLEDQLRDAVKREQYERAAQLRDSIRALKQTPQGL